MINFQEQIKFHKHWLETTEVLVNTDYFDAKAAAEASDSNQCKLGQFILDIEQDALISEDPLYQLLRKYHNLFHSKMSDIYLMKSRQMHNETKELLKEVTQISEQLIHLLSSLEQATQNFEKMQKNPNEELDTLASRLLSH